MNHTEGSPQKPLIELKGVSRNFGSRCALQPLDFSLQPGQITVLVGPNGSGKTTLLKMTAGLIRHHSGQLQVCGYQPFQERQKVMQTASFCFTPPPLHNNLTAWEHLHYFRGLGRQNPPGPRALQHALETVGLQDRAHERVGHFSLGMRQRLGLAMAITPMPQLLVLDEPADGLDPLAVLELRALLLRLRNQHGLAILLASHLLTDLEKTADSAVVLLEGAALYQGCPKAFVAQPSGWRLRVSRAADQAAALLTQNGMAAQQLGDHWLRLDSTQVQVEAIQHVLATANIALTQWYQPRQSFEQAFLQVLRNRRAQAGVKP